MPPNKRLNLSVQYACNEAGLPSRPDIRRWARAALDVDGKRGGQITVRFVDTGEASALNSDYRSKDYATNVLTFPYEIEPVVCGGGSAGWGCSGGVVGSGVGSCDDGGSRSWCCSGIGFGVGGVVGRRG